jgi:transposase
MTDPLALTLTREQALDWLHRRELLTTAQAALVAGVGEGTIYQWVYRKWLTPYTRSRPRLYRREDVERCADERISNDMRLVASRRAALL